jgi:methylated-DNA-protein-cysteine methyltransferase-like protein
MHMRMPNPAVTTMMPDKRLYQRIYALVRQVPPGSVTTYGVLAQQAGCTARTVGFAMAALPSGHDVPWHRVINSQGRVSPRADGDGSLIQQLLLEAEGVHFDDRERIDLERFGWNFYRQV